MKHLYARISTDDRNQNIDTQLHMILSMHPDIDVIWTDEGVRGKSEPLDREGFRNLYSSLEPSDEIVVMELSRISRKTIKMLSLYEELNSKGVTITSLSEGTFKGGNYDDYFRLTILAGVNQRESHVMGTRIKAGMARARNEGKLLGRKSTGDMEAAKRMLNDGHSSIPHVVTVTGVSRATLYRMKKELSQ